MEEEFRILEGKDWFIWNLGRKVQEWDLVFGVACWLLWQWRNRGLFEEEFKLPGRLGEAVKGYVREIRVAQVDFGRIGGIRVEQQVSWKTPCAGWLKLNVDGAAKGEDRLAGCGGLIRDDSGKWISGFARKLGRCSAIQAELWAVISGLELASGLQIQNIIVESDSSAVVELMHKLIVGEDTEVSLLTEIRWALNLFKRIKISHVYREGNSCADALANYSFVQKELKVIFALPPVCVTSCLYRDNVGIAYPRDTLM
ncbi:hypothetical protein QN277_008804 [Acacia crassicarpa]|uniref:RNase H type-1 domain-containing protein n=1 Tax=Acacia crassicarpa TaxID=499986 RepID=A0AAE1MDH5_9FABA|nr:hypothetical protein QN277_008804 [Acacia crassicarpa]